jgi:hypothetical protein
VCKLHTLASHLVDAFDLWAAYFLRGKRGAHRWEEADRVLEWVRLMPIARWFHDKLSQNSKIGSSFLSGPFGRFHDKMSQNRPPGRESWVTSGLAAAA